MYDICIIAFFEGAIDKSSNFRKILLKPMGLEWRIRNDTGWKNETEACSRTDD